MELRFFCVFPTETLFLDFPTVIGMKRLFINAVRSMVRGRGLTEVALVGSLMAVLILGGCRSSRVNLGTNDVASYNAMMHRMERPNLCDEQCEVTDHLRTGPPATVKNWRDLEKWPLTLDEAIAQALANSKVLQKLGGRVVSGPAGTNTIYDPAISATNPLASSEAALSAFDAQVSTSLFINHDEASFNNLFFGGGASSLITNSANFNYGLTKTTARGTQFSIRNVTTYNRNNSPVNLFRSVWDTTNTVEVRQPLLRGNGTAINRIAGPNAVAGNYNGVLIARIREDVSVIDFETAIRDLVNDTEQAYWELYFAYKDLDAKISARDLARETWENRDARVKGEIARADEEAQARQQYYTFQQQVDNALSGRLQGSLGVLGAERNLRRVMGLLNNDGRMIRPTTDPTIAPVTLDWNSSQDICLQDRAELRRQKWAVKQRELELFAACQLNKWRLDLVGNYGFQGFGDDLFGQSGIPNGSAVSDLFDGNLDDWQLGFELSGAIGRRTGHLAIRNAQLQLAREKALLREQQRQLLHDLNAAYVEVDRAFAAIKTAYNSRLAILEELEPKKKRANEGEENIFFFLDVQQRAVTAQTQLDRAIIDYNLALLNYARVSGTLLRQYNIDLAEGPWNDVAQQEMEQNSRQLFRSIRPRRRDMAPIAR